MQACADRYGDTFTVRQLGFPPMVFFTDPGAIRQIFTGDPDQFRSGKANAVFEPFFGPNSLLLLDGARHRRERRLLMPPFHGKRMRLYGEMMCEIADRSIDAWPVDTSFPVYARLQDITLEIMLRVVFGVADESRLFRLRAAAVEALDLWDVGNPLRPIKAWLRFGRVRREVHELLHDEVRRRRAARPEERTDIMSMLVTARDEDGWPMSDEEVRDEMFTMLVAGHETTATLLAWVIHRLLEHPDVLAATRAEVASVVGSGPHLPPPDAEQIGRLGYLDAVIKGDGAPPPGRAHRRAPARDGPYRRLRYAAGRLYYRAMHLPRSPPTRPVARAEFVRPPPVRGEAHGLLYVLPVRRRGAPLPGRSVRDLRDEDRVGPRVVTRDPATGSRLCRACRAAWSGAGPFFRPAGDTHGGLTAAGTFTGPCRPRTGASTGASKTATSCVANSRIGSVDATPKRFGSKVRGNCGHSRCPNFSLRVGDSRSQAPWYSHGFSTRTSARLKSATLRETIARSFSFAIAAMKRSGWPKVMPLSLPRAMLRRHSRITSSSIPRIRPVNQGRSVPSSHAVSVVRNPSSECRSMP